MIKIFLLCLVSLGFSLDQTSLIHVLDTATTPRVVYIDDNDAALLTGINEAADTINALTDSIAVHRDSIDALNAIDTDLFDSIAVHRDSIDTLSGRFRDEPGYIKVNTGVIMDAGEFVVSVDSNGITKTLILGDSGIDLDKSIGNISIGFNAISGLRTGAQNIGLGTTALGTGAGVNIGDIAIGTDAGGRMGAGDSANYNIAIGERAGYTMDGSYNVALGLHAGETAAGDSSVFIGNYAGQLETGGNKLYIDNTPTTTPLIYGEFDSDSVLINGNLEIAGNMFMHSVDVAGSISKTGVNSIVSTGTSIFAGVDVSNVSIIEADCSIGSIEIRGLANGVKGDIVDLYKVVDVTNNLIVRNNNAGGTQKIFLKSGADETISTLYGWSFYFDGTQWIER